MSSIDNKIEKKKEDSLFFNKLNFNLIKEDYSNKNKTTKFNFATP